MKTADVIAKAGTASDLARVLGITPAAVSQWGETVPLLREYQLRELRPEWFSEHGSKPTSEAMG